jgi:hypothetical protein
MWSADNGAFDCFDESTPQAGVTRRKAVALHAQEGTGSCLT